MDGKGVRRTGFQLALFSLLALVGSGVGSLAFSAVGSLAFSETARAAGIEISGMAAYSSANLGGGYSTLSRRYTATVDLKFTQVSAIEFEYTNSYSEYTSQNYLSGLVSTPIKEQEIYKDNIFSLNWVQNLVSTKWIIQPYFIIGGGRMNRHFTDSYPDVPYSQSVSQNVFTGTGGAGLRLFLTRSMAIKIEAKTYVPNFQFSKWKDNEMISAGLSWAF